MHVSKHCPVSVLFIAAALLSSTSALDSSLPPRLPGLWQRDAVSCSAIDPKLPSNFQCQPNANCISLDSSSSALCCPVSMNNTCVGIQPINCDVSAQNATANPSAPIFTTKLDAELPQCGEACCPFGYECLVTERGEIICSIINSTSIVGKTNPSASSESSSSTSSASKTTTSSTSTTTPASTIGAAAAQAKPQCDKFPVGIFLAGLFPGMFVGAFLMLGWVICSGRHRKPSSRDSSGSSISYKPTISDPIPMANGGGLRTDFLRKTTDRAKSMFSAKGDRDSQQYANNWKMPTPPAVAAVPVTPERRLPHEADGESIKVYSPPSATQQPYPPHIAPLRGMTTQRLPYIHTTNGSMGSPFQTPPTNNTSTNTNRMSATLRNERGVSVLSEASALSPKNEILTPARYEGGFNPTKRTDISRPNTTFTEMLHEVGFPDPIIPQNDTPAVPKIPEGYKNRL